MKKNILFHVDDFSFVLASKISVDSLPIFNLFFCFFLFFCSYNMYFLVFFCLYYMYYCVTLLCMYIFLHEILSRSVIFILFDIILFIDLMYLFACVVSFFILKLKILQLFIFYQLNHLKAS